MNLSLELETSTHRDETLDRSMQCPFSPQTTTLGLTKFSSFSSQILICKTLQRVFHCPKLSLLLVARRSVIL